MTELGSDAGIVHEDAYRSESRLRGVNEARPGLLARNVMLDEEWMVPRG
jgi:hypothetical protein